MSDDPYVVTPPAGLAEGDDQRSPILIRVSDIAIDSNMQRPVNADKLAKLGAFDFDLAEAITLVQRTDGRYICIEGQHRTELLRTQNPSAKVWGMLLPGPVDEAGIALAITKSRKAHSSYERFGLELASGDDYAIAVQQVLDRVGVSLSNYKRQIPGNQRIAAVAAVRQIVRMRGSDTVAGAALLEQVLGTIKIAFDEQTDMWASLLIRAVAQVITRNENLNGERLTQVLAKQSPSRWLQETAHKREGQPAMECIAIAIITEYNRGLHQQNRIAW